MTGHEMSSGKVGQSPRAMNLEFQAWQKATEFIRQIAPHLPEKELETREQKLYFMAEIVQWMFERLFGIDDELVQFTMGQNRVFLQARDDIGRKYQVSVKR